MSVQNTCVQNMCRFVFYTLFVYAIVQIQFRWKHDSEEETKPWRKVFYGNTSLYNATATVFQFPESTGTRLTVLNNTFTVERAVPVEIHGIINIKGPPLQLHRFEIISNGVTLRAITSVSPTSVDFIHRMDMRVAHNLQFVHYYVDFVDSVSVSNANIEVGFSRLNGI